MSVALVDIKPVSFGIYRELSKSGIVALVLISVLGGYLAGHPFEQSLDGIRLVITLLGVLGVAAGSSALNHWQDREMDALMPRTAKRPLPSGRISEAHVLVFSFGAMIVGITLLSLLSWKLVVLAATAIFSYNVLYTLWWKRTMPFAAVPGAIPGALPILMGYVAAQGDVVTPGGIYLFAILFFWQMPHFWVLALRFTDDYAKGGVPTLPVAHGTRLTIGQIVVWCLAYCALALGAPLFFRVGSVYLSVSILICAKLLWELRLFAKGGDKIADPGSKFWLRFFLWINFSLIGFIGAIVADLWSIYLIRNVTAAETSISSTYEFPEDRSYGKKDQGFGKYGAASLHGKRKIVLTFDDGPDGKRGPILLDILKKYNVQATFFMVGDAITPSTIDSNLRRELREGHTIGAHSMHHDDMDKLSEPAFKADLWSSLSKLFPAMRAEGVNQKEVYYRYPFGAYGANPAYNSMNSLRDLSYEKYGENCINFVFWNVDSEDWVEAMTPQKIADGIVAQLEGGTAYEHVRVNGKFTVRSFHVNPATAPRGGVVLMHEVHDRSLAALPILLDKLAKAGYEIVPLPTVKEYSFQGKTCQLRSQTSNR
jgi:protoheme IX farnesyltransferase